MEFLYNPFDLVLIDLDICSEHKSVVFGLLLTSSQRELYGDIVVRLVSLGCSLSRVFELPPELQGLGPLGRWMVCMSS